MTQEEFNTLKAAQKYNQIATELNHSFVWHATSTGFKARCINPNCRLTVTVDNDGKAELTIVEPLPKCKL